MTLVDEDITETHCTKKFYLDECVILWLPGLQFLIKRHKPVEDLWQTIMSLQSAFRRACMLMSTDKLEHTSVYVVAR